MTIAQMKVDALVSAKEIEIEISRGFIERYQNRATIAASFTVDVAAGVPNGQRFDGDFHIAGRAPQIGLPVIAEIINATSQQPAMDLIHHIQGTGRTLDVSGVWRIWPEHGGGGPARQDEEVDPLGTPFAGHVFEIHPVTKLGRHEFLDSFVPVEGYRPGGARRTFEIFEKATATLKVTPTTIRLVTQTGLFNDVHFLLEIAEDHQRVVSDGRFVIVAARELTGNLIVERLRTVFVKGTAPERAVQHLRRGDRLHVWGLARVNYAEIARMALGTPARLTGPLPYEIVILGVYQDK